MSNEIYKFKNFTVSDVNIAKAYQFWKDSIIDRYGVQPHTITNDRSKFELDVELVISYFKRLPEPKSVLEVYIVIMMAITLHLIYCMVGFHSLCYNDDGINTLEDFYSALFEKIGK